MDSVSLNWLDYKKLVEDEGVDFKLLKEARASYLGVSG
jgi:hypothetical protein